METVAQPGAINFVITSGAVAAISKLSVTNA